MTIPTTTPVKVQSLRKGMTIVESPGGGHPKFIKVDEVKVLVGKGMGHVHVNNSMCWDYGYEVQILDL